MKGVTAFGSLYTVEDYSVRFEVPTEGQKTPLHVLQILAQQL